MPKKISKRMPKTKPVKSVKSKKLQKKSKKNSYRKFVKKMTPVLRKENPDLKQTKIMKLIADEWRKTSEGSIRGGALGPKKTISKKPRSRPLNVAAMDSSPEYIKKTDRKTLEEQEKQTLDHFARMQKGKEISKLMMTMDVGKILDIYYEHPYLRMKITEIIKDITLPLPYNKMLKAKETIESYFNISNIREGIVTKILNDEEYNIKEQEREKFLEKRKSEEELEYQRESELKEAGKRSGNPLDALGKFLNYRYDKKDVDYRRSSQPQKRSGNAYHFPTFNDLPRGTKAFTQAELFEMGYGAPR